LYATSGNDIITISATHITLNGVAIPYSGIESLRIFSMGGTDSVSTSGTVTLPFTLVDLGLEAGPDQTPEGSQIALPDAVYSSPLNASQLTLTINWGDGNSEPGVLVPGTGNTGTVSNTHNYTVGGTHTVTLTLHDGTHTITDSFQVTITSLNHPPSDITLSHSSVPEDEPVGTTIGNFTTTDPDEGDFFSYTLVSGTGDIDNARFSISGSTLSTAETFDHEYQNSYSIRVRTTDLLGASFEKIFTISITNIDEGPLRISAVTPLGPTNQAVSELQVTFSQRVDLNTLSVSDVAVHGPQGAVVIRDITPVAGGHNRSFEIAFDSQTAAGDYTVVIGPAITDLAGHPLEAAGRYAFTIDRVGPRALSAEPTGILKSAADHVDVLFNEELGNLPASQVTLTGPGGSIPVGTPIRIAPHTWRIPFATQTASGDYTLTVGPGVTDLAGNLLDQDADGIPGETTDDQFSTTLTLALPDLAPASLTLPATANPGQLVTVSWTTSNQGATAGAIPVQETLWLSDDAIIGNDRYLGDFTFTDLGTRTVQIMLPTFGQGSGGEVYLVVATDSDAAVDELDETNNTAIAGSAIELPRQLSLTLPAEGITEGDQPQRAVVSRTGSTTQPLVVTLASSDTGELTLPASVTIPAGESGVAFLVTPVSDQTADGLQVVSLTAT
ncbi:MAG: Ig-like domain-containing protein, partial [Planctomycetaceae bacterium]